MAVLVKLLGGCAVEPDACHWCRADYNDCDGGEWDCWAGYCICLIEHDCEPCVGIANDQ